MKKRTVETIIEKLTRQGRFRGLNRQGLFYGIKSRINPGINPRIKCTPDGMTEEEEAQYWKEENA